MLGFYNYTVILTYLGMLTSFFGLTLAMRGDVCAALICLLVSGAFDMFDGKVASTKKDRTDAEKRFGIQIDSLSDLVCFGVLPAAIVYAASGYSVLGLIVGGLYVLCALIRLAWFNVDEEERQHRTQSSRKVYVGLPVTGSALILPVLMGLARLEDWPEDMIGMALLVLMAGAFLTPFQIKKPERPGRVGLLACGGAGLYLILKKRAGL